MVDEVYPVELTDVERARTIVYGSERLSARDAIHIATMERHGVTRVLSFDVAFDEFPGLERLQF